MQDVKTERDEVMGNKKEVARALLCLGLPRTQALIAAEWYCKKIERESMWETGLFDTDCEYLSLDDFKLNAYRYHLMHTMEMRGDEVGAAYVCEASYSNREGKCARMRAVLLEAAYSEDLTTEDIAFLMKLDKDQAKKELTVS